MFEKGQSYTRRKISDLIGGQIQGYMGTSNKVVIGVYLEKKSNPNAPYEILSGIGRDVSKHGKWLCEQNEPVPVFIKRKSNEWIYHGIYQVDSFDLDEQILETAQRKAFRDKPLSRIINMIEVNAENEFKKKVNWSRNLTNDQRKKRLAGAEKKPKEKPVTVNVFVRNPDVVAEALERANGICEGCSSPAPFNRKSDGSPFLEVHHIQQLANGGDDTIDNTLAVCPNCHRELHYG